MINIFYEPGYAKRKKILLTFKFKKSVLFNKLIDLAYLFNSSIPSRLISNGPHKLMNNVVKTFKKNKLASFNKIQFENSFITQFDDFGEDTLKKIIKNNKKNSKVIVGPLYTTNQLKRLNQYTKEYKNIKILAASESAANSLINNLDIGIDSSQICVLPIGVISEKQISHNKNNLRTKNECLVYFKNRDEEDLEKVVSLMNSEKIKTRVFKYGEYDNNVLISQAKKSKFGIIISSTESQGFAIQELMAFNLPLLVWDSKKSKFEDKEIEGTSVPYWSSDCGEIVDTYSDLEKQLITFLENIKIYKPQQLILNKLTFEKFSLDLIKEFEKF